MPDPISTLALATGGAFLGKFVGPAAEHLGKMALERAQQLGEQATALLATVGRKPQPVEPKLLVPLVQAASLEADPTLADLWAALLANAADPVQQAKVQPSFVSILREITVYDALILELIDKAAHRVVSNNPTQVFTPIADIQGALESLKATDLYVSIDNLARLNLCVSVGSQPVNNGMPRLPFHEAYVSVAPGKQNTAITHLGLAFLAAVTPPTA